LQECDWSPWEQCYGRVVSRIDDTKVMIEVFPENCECYLVECTLFSVDERDWDGGVKRGDMVGVMVGFSFRFYYYLFLRFFVLILFFASFA
jgi:hypothetical protein